MATIEAKLHSQPPRLNPPITIARVHVTSSHSPINVSTYLHTYWLLSRRPTDWGLRWRRKPHKTLSQDKKADYIHSQRARNEGARKNPDQKYSNSPKKANILQTTYITPSTQTRPPCITRACSGHVTSPSNTHVSTWCHACRWHESDNFHTNPSVSQRTRTCTHFPRQRTTLLAHTKPRNVQQNLIRKWHCNRHEVSLGNLTRKLCSKQQQISQEILTTLSKSMKSHKKIS